MSPEANMVCPECEKIPSKEALWEHNLRMHTDPKLWKHKCLSCYRIFPLARDLKDHMWHHIGKKSFKCEVCDERFTKKDALTNHMNVHKSPGLSLPKTNVVCPECKKTMSKLAIWEHKLRKHTDPKLWKYKCSSCTRTFPFEKELKLHLWHHTGEKPLKCEVCDKRLVSEQSLIRHLSAHKPPKYVCELCKKKFHSILALREHERYLHFSNSKWICKICRLSFDTAFDHSEHLVDHRRKNVCEICLKEFLHKRNLVWHLESHKNMEKLSEVKKVEKVKVKKVEKVKVKKVEKVKVKKVKRLFECDKCPKVFSGPLTLKNHKDSVHEKIRYTCDICLQDFSSVRLRSIHNHKTHTKEK